MSRANLDFAAARAILAALAFGAVSGLACAQAPESAEPAKRPPPAFDPRSCSKPEWPAGAAEAGKTGTVTVVFLIGTDGKVRKSRIIKSSGHADLDDAALASLAKCTFRPGTRDGEPAEAWLPVQYVWR
ncbi:energy transducer TonB [Pseudoduganella sp. GCM10020061]|uniref:energy transducer TonB n=1 Tax=Pseudoduganella sp. GCM10020061 TaxID=3317345 RepID=UPI00363A8677